MRPPQTRIELWIPNEPKPKGRPRSFTGPSGRPRIYTPESTQAYENHVKGTAMIDMYRAGLETFPPTVPLRVRIDFFLQVPMSKPLKWREKAIGRQTRPTKRPDLDNLEKAILDALNGTAWSDDSQIVELMSAKWWAMEPGARVIIETVEASNE